MSHLVLSGLTKRFGDATVVAGLDLSVSDGEAVVVLGPSGCGKTTCLRMVAGFERPDDGEIRLGGRCLAGPGTFVPPERRGMSVVFQSYALWPHMTVEQNVGYGPTTARVGRAEVRRRVAEALGLVRLPDAGRRYVHQLSGGQQQRVALARALVNDPALLLLDEPLSNLDTHLREELRAEVKRIQRSLGVTMLYVTHDQAEALSLADRLVVMNSGEIAQVGSPEEVYRRPRNSYVARALGTTNILTATGSPAGRGYLRVLGNVDAAVEMAGEPGAGGVVVSVRPADVTPVPVSDAEEPTGRIAEALFFGDLVQYRVDVPGRPTPVKANGPGTRLLAVGTEVRLEITPGALAPLDDETTGSGQLPVPA
ncbi:ABC transporter ATP-binding protein [Pseudonocardia nematodicida]|uniref:ABC transporter ATP-binding protein n=1 Tax=Pseudonocardia nematodicida TaxID=1206997 RepID=A0ABV1KIH9_9PSEU